MSISQFLLRKNFYYYYQGEKSDIIKVLEFGRYRLFDFSINVMEVTVLPHIGKFYVSYPVFIYKKKKIISYVKIEKSFNIVKVTVSIPTSLMV